MKKKKIFCDMDGTLCDFMGAFHYYKEKDSKVKYPQSKVGFFENLRPLPGAIESFNLLKEHYDMWILTRPSFKNIHCFSEKAQWILDNLGFDVLENMVISGDKSIVKGDFLIDDHHGDGQPEFEGEWIHFGQKDFENWEKVTEYLINKKETE